MKIVITGGNFINKGAQAMLLITMSELKTRYPDIEYYYTTREKMGLHKEYKFNYMYKWAFIDALGLKSGRLKGFRAFKQMSVEAAKAFVLKNPKVMFKEFKYLKQLDDIACIIDVSGFALASKFSNRINKGYLELIEYAKGSNIPIILMPQSFGPFDYKENKDAMVARISKALEYPSLIFAREQEGYDLLTKQIGISNVHLSDDLVLQNEEVNWDLLADTDALNKDVYKVTTKNNVAIVPNMKVMGNAPDPESVYETYRCIINKWLKLNRNIYLVWHSDEDLDICRRIKNMFKDQNQVILIDKELACYDYEKVVSSFDYIFASRFHSIVLAYRQGVPAVGLGWAIKYQNLFNSCNQDQYITNVADVKDIDSILAKLEKMENNYKAESAKIKAGLAQIRKDNCFDTLFETLDKIIKDYE